jgi:hypothetical protein
LPSYSGSCPLVWADDEKASTRRSTDNWSPRSGRASRSGLSCRAEKTRRSFRKHSESFVAAAWLFCIYLVAETTCERAISKRARLTSAFGDRESTTFEGHLQHKYLYPRPPIIVGVRHIRLMPLAHAEMLNSTSSRSDRLLHNVDLYWPTLDLILNTSEASVAIATRQNAATTR